MRKLFNKTIMTIEGEKVTLAELCIAVISFVLFYVFASIFT